MVPWPAMTRGSSKGAMKVRDSTSESRWASALAASKFSPRRRTSPPSDRTASILMLGVTVGMTMVARTPRTEADRATPWAWLPAEAVTTPRARWASVRERMAL